VNILHTKPAAFSEKDLGLLSDGHQTLHNDRAFYPKQSYHFFIEKELVSRDKVKCENLSKKLNLS